MPADKLNVVLEKYPNAVVLSREQYEALVRDAALDKKPAPSAPRRAALTGAKFQARLAGKVVEVTAVLAVNVLGDEWAQVPLDFSGAALGAVNVDGEAALVPERVPLAVSNNQKAAPAANAGAPTALLLHGRGERKVTVEFTLPVTLETGLSRLRIKLPSAAASAFVFDLPPNQRVESPQPISVKKTPEATSVTTALSPSNPVLELSWRGAGGAAQALEPLVQANGIYTIDAEKVRAEFGFVVETQLGNAPTAFQIALPANVKVLLVTGDELAKWEMVAGKLAITLQPGERAAAKFWLAFEMPSLAAAARATLALPVPRVDGLARMQGVFSIVGDAGVTVEQVATDGSVQATERACDPVPHFVASYKFTTPPAGPRVTVERVQPRFSADLDTLVEFKPDAVFIERALTLHREKGDVFSTALTLPAGEEVLGVRQADESEPDWRIEAGKLRLRWSDTGAKNAERVFKIRTRIEPEKWTQLGADGLTFALGDALIDGAEKITGYIALKADDSFRLEAEASETLERRDGRTTPVQGDYAWFRRTDFSLKVKVAKRPGEVLASLTGYALPLEGVLDLHAQMNFQFLHSGARSVRMRVPKALAANFNFDGPQIAERNLADDIWTVVFQKELTGSYALKITAQVPVAMAKDAAESRFNVAVPVIAPLDVVRASGVWAVEANTETEITFDAKGMNELDSLLAPRLPDYQPRHRVIGVFAWLGADYTLALAGVRHAPAAVLTSVVDQLTLDTVVSTSGTERSQAVFQVRTASAQYLDVRLPEKSRLLSLTVDDELVKPVGDRADQVRVQLPARRDASAALAVSVLYETPKGEWRSSGAYAARAPQLAKDIPILRSEWRLHLPDGFEYTGLESNLRVPEPEPARPLVAELFYGSLGLLTTKFGAHEGAPDSVAAERVRQLLAEAEGFYDVGRFEFAFKRCEQILNIDKYNKAARAMEEKIDRAKSDFSVTGYNETRARAISQTDAAWANPVRRFNVDPSEEGTSKIQRKLQRIIIPRLEFKEATLRESIDFLKRKSVELDPEDPKTGVEMIFKAMDPAESNARVTVSLSNIPLIEVLKYVTGLAEVKFKIEPDGVAIVPQSVNTDVIVTKAWVVPASLREILGAGNDGAKNWLIAQGVQFSGTANAVFVRPMNHLIVRNSQDQIDLIDTLVDALTPPPEPAREKSKSRNQALLAEPAKDPGNISRVQRKLERIIIPKLEFREATIREALDYLKRKSIELDPDDPKTGLNIVLKVETTTPSAAPVEPGNPAEARITVSLSNIPMIEALKYVTGLANLKFKVEPYAVSIVPQSVSTDVVITKEWTVRPDLIPGIASGVAADRESAKQWLVSNGVQFNGSASAIYISASHRLIVRNTQDQLDLIDTILNSGSAAAPQGAGLANPGDAYQQRVSGLLPMKIELPLVGRVVVLEGLSGAERVEFRYDDWWGRARRLWLWFVAGGLGCLFVAGMRPWWRTCWVVLWLTFIPLVVSVETMAICNALLAGWLVSVVLQRVAARLVFARGKKEVLA